MMSEPFKLRLYLETTVFNWYFDPRPGHEEVVRLFEAIRDGGFKGYTSKYVVDELEDAPEPKRSEMLALIEEYGITVLGYNADADNLAQKYIAHGLIPASHIDDSTHIAAAFVHGLDAIISYNFHHINRTKTIIGASIMGLYEGYSPVIICTAEEVLKYGANY